MEHVEAFHQEAAKIRDLAEEFDIIEASVIEALFDALEENEIDIRDYL